MKLVVGLGNPGEQYALTRHNLGWWVVEDLAETLQVRNESHRCGGTLATKGEVGLFKPLTYMNESGRAVAELAGETGVALSEFLVVVDDLNLELGSLRLRTGGSAGGHRGLESIIQSLGTDEFPRLRLGIGPCPAGVTARDFVLSTFNDDELPAAEEMVKRAVQAVQCWINEGAQAAMSRYNTRPEQQEGPTEA